MQESIKSSIQIVLDDSSHAKLFEAGRLIHQYEYERAIAFVNQAIPKELKKSGEKYLHNTITIFGTRGSGKTSFLLSLCDFYIKHPKLFALQQIDPTLIEEKGHVFLNVIALIKQEVAKVLDKDPPTETTRERKRKWRDQLMKLAAGLPSIEGMGAYNSDRWQDPEYVLDNGLSGVGAALNLAENFDLFLIESLEILGKTCFLLAFDDIDVDATKGWAVLETIRKYFTTSRLITLLSGDVKLYSTVVRQKKWSNFGSEILKYETERADQSDKLAQFNSMVTELESQYLQKIMQPKFRIHLLSLLEKKRINRLPEVWVSYSNDQPSIELITLYRSIFEKYGIRNNGQAEVFLTFMLSQPLRTQIQFTTIMFAFLNTEKDEIQLSEESVVLPWQKSEQITDIFLADLLEHQVDINLANSTVKYLNIIVLELLLKTGQLKDLYQLQPSTTKSGLNACLITLNMLLSKSFRERGFYLTFDYQIKIGYLRNLLELLPLNSPTSNQPSITDLVSKTGLLNDGVLRDFTGKINAYLIGVQDFNGSNRAVTSSYINLRGLNASSKSSHQDRLDVIFKDNGSIKTILGILPSYSVTYSYKNTSTVSYSIFMVIASLGELLKVYENSLEEQALDGVKSALRELSQHRTYSAPDFRRGDSILHTVAEEENPSEFQTTAEESNVIGFDNETTQFAEQFLSWMRVRPNTHGLAVHLLGKISTRVYFAIQNIVERKPSAMLLGELIHFQIIALLNAVLIEDVRENMSDSSHLNINNTAFAESILVNNLNKTMASEKFISSGSALKFSKWLLSCPLLLGYIKYDPSSPLRNVMNKYSEGVQFANFSVTEELDKVSIQNTIATIAAIKESKIVDDPRFSLRSSLTKPGNEVALVKEIKRLTGSVDLLRLDSNIGIIANRNREMKKILPGLFPNNRYYTDNMRKLRLRVHKVGLI